MERQVVQNAGDILILLQHPKSKTRPRLSGEGFQTTKSLAGVHQVILRQPLEDPNRPDDGPEASRMRQDHCGSEAGITGCDV